MVVRIICVKLEKILIFRKKGKMVISVKIRNFSKSRSDNETDFTVGIVSQNLATTSNFIEF